MSYTDNFWRSSGIARRLEEDLGHSLHHWFCGHGVVYSFGAAKDGSSATDAYPDSGTTDRTGNLTKAFIHSRLATGGGTILEGFDDVRQSIDDSNESWKGKMQRQFPNDWNKDDFRYAYLFQQKPRMGSSHYCFLNRPLFL